MKKALLVITLLTLLAMSAMADPFSDAWEWESPKLVGKVKSIKEFYKSGAFKITTYTPEGQRIQTEYTDPQGEKRILAKYVYDEQGNFTEYHVFKPDGTINFKEVCTYKSKGIKNTLEKIKEGSKRPEKATFDYDDRGFRTGINMLNQSGEAFMTFTYLFDDNGRLVEAGLKETNRGMRAEIKVEYNDKGFVKESTRSKPGEPPVAIVKFEYEYDETGNWISRKTSFYKIKDGEEILGNEKTEKREIEYY
jgi:hypothetical protein